MAAHPGLIDAAFMEAKAVLTADEIRARELEDVISFDAAQKFLLNKLVVDTMQNDQSSRLLVLNMRQFTSALTGTPLVPFKLKGHGHNVFEIALPHACWWWGSLFGIALQRYKEAAQVFGILSASIKTQVAVTSITVAAIHFLAGVGADLTKVDEFMSTLPASSKHAPTRKQCEAAALQGVSIAYWLHCQWVTATASSADKRAAKTLKITLTTYLVYKSRAANASSADKLAANKLKITLPTFLGYKMLVTNASPAEKRAAKNLKLTGIEQVAKLIQRKRQASNSRKHKQLGTSQCPTCQFCYTQSTSLKRHLNSATPRTRFTSMPSTRSNVLQISILFK